MTVVIPQIVIKENACLPVDTGQGRKIIVRILMNGAVRIDGTKITTHHLVPVTLRLIVSLHLGKDIVMIHKQQRH